MILIHITLLFLLLYLLLLLLLLLLLFSFSMFVSFILQIMHICFMREEVSSLSIVQRVDALFSEEEEKETTNLLYRSGCDFIFAQK